MLAKLNTCSRVIDLYWLDRIDLFEDGNHDLVLGMSSLDAIRANN